MVRSYVTWGMFVLLHALLHPWLLLCIVVRVVTPLYVLLVHCGIGTLVGFVVLCGCMLWLACRVLW